MLVRIKGDKWHRTQTRRDYFGGPGIGGTRSAFWWLSTPPATSTVRSWQVNAYFYANAIRDWLLSHHPTYPTLDQGSFVINANRTDFLCPEPGCKTPFFG